jgi:hypothetical protein
MTDKTVDDRGLQFRIAAVLRQYAGAFYIDCADGSAGMLERAANSLAERVAEALTRQATEQQGWVWHPGEGWILERQAPGQVSDDALVERAVQAGIDEIVRVEGERENGPFVFSYAAAEQGIRAAIEAMPATNSEAVSDDTDDYCPRCAMPLGACQCGDDSQVSERRPNPVGPDPFKATAPAVSDGKIREHHGSVSDDAVAERVAVDMTFAGLADEIEKAEALGYTQMSLPTNTMRQIIKALSAKAVSERIADLELALDLALAWLGEQEPGDSRAVSNEFVAMAAIRCEQDRLDECREIIRTELAKLGSRAP